MNKYEVQTVLFTIVMAPLLSIAVILCFRFHSLILPFSLFYVFFVFFMWREAIVTNGLPANAVIRYRPLVISFLGHMSWWVMLFGLSGGGENFFYKLLLFSLFPATLTAWLLDLLPVFPLLWLCSLAAIYGPMFLTLWLANKVFPKPREEDPTGPKVVMALAVLLFCCLAAFQYINWAENRTPAGNEIQKENSEDVIACSAI